MREKILQTGLLLGYGEYDWFAGANSPIVRNVLLDSGNWKELTIPHEIQFLTEYLYDTLMCVAFNGTTDAIEYIMMQQLRLGLIPAWKVNWLRDNGYFVNGVLDFNERYTAIMGETTNEGAYLYKVADGMRKFGLIPQKMFPMADNFKDNIDKKFVTEEMLELGKEFARIFPMNFEWVIPQATKDFMKYSPISCTGFYGNIQNEDDIIDPRSGSYHSMLQVKETDEYREIDDSYYDQFKKYKKTALANFMAFYVDSSDNTMFNANEFISKHDNFQIRNTQTGAYGVIYHGTPMLITQERAGLYTLDRDARGLLGKGRELTVQLTNQEWSLLDWSHKF